VKSILSQGTLDQEDREWVVGGEVESRSRKSKSPEWQTPGLPFITTH
jgi:hypothetical protein